MLRTCRLVAIVLLTVCLSRVAHGQLIIAHRGASHDAPENTLAAFRLAWEQQADGIEGDFYLTKDRQIVCTHDKTTERTAPGHPQLTVADTTLAELQQLDVGTWKHPKYAGERMPTLSQVLETVPEHGRIFVEIKCGPEILPVMQPQLEACGLKPEQIVIICFNANVIAQARAMMPQYKANWLTSYKQEPEGSPWTPSQSDVLQTLQETDATGLGSKGEFAVLDESFVTAIQKQGDEFHVWTINDLKSARYFQSLGAASITTDRPALLREGLDAGSDQ
ncbi:MAG: glycerophosphodiester phosphodiesterase [Planctomycetaceae bacterium]|nr:glycerophosphodiester phosphodiesterase [Planctomycetaceae bacterium]